MKMLSKIILSLIMVVCTNLVVFGMQQVPEEQTEGVTKCLDILFKRIETSEIIESTWKDWHWFYPGATLENELKIISAIPKWHRDSFFMVQNKYTGTTLLSTMLLRRGLSEDRSIYSIP
ncbi:MAG: hypothetical protein LLF94_00320, partial [Chlamydiales bacterium]|nr:hypothetical protein [Chlamydiales bacterium]